MEGLRIQPLVSDWESEREGDSGAGRQAPTLPCHARAKGDLPWEWLRSSAVPCPSSMTALYAGERAASDESSDATPSPPDESALIEAFRDGDPAAARSLVDATYGRIHDALSRLCGDADLAADLTQETYRKAWQSLGEFGGRARFSTWLFRIAYNTFLNHVRRPLRVVPLGEAEAATLADPAPGGEEAMSALEEHRRLRQAVLALGEQLRFTVTAHYWAELPTAEIARLEGVSGAAIRKRLAKALEILEVSLQEVAP